MAVFTPSEDWQPVPDGVSIPGGLEVKMDIENGGRWARLLKPENADSGENTVAVAPAPLDQQNLDLLEDKAHDYDDGAEIIATYGAALYKAFTDPQNPDQDQAGRILSICLRNNKDAFNSLVTACPELPATLGLTKRSISILSALISTPDGLQLATSHGTLRTIQRLLAESTPAEMDKQLAKYIVKLLQDLVIAGVDGSDICDWVDALQQAYYNTNNATLKKLAIDIVEHNGDFASLTVKCSPQPGLLSREVDRKRAAESAKRFPNPKATRNHFDDL